MGDDHDAGLAGSLQRGLDGLDVNRNHADCVNALGNQVVNQLGLQGRVDFGGALLIDGVLGMCSGVLLNTGVHANEPGVGSILRDDDDLPALCESRSAGQDHDGSHEQSNKFLHFVFPPFFYVHSLRR